MFLCKLEMIMIMITLADSCCSHLKEHDIIFVSIIAWMRKRFDHKELLLRWLSTCQGINSQHDCGYSTNCSNIYYVIKNPKLIIFLP